MRDLDLLDEKAHVLTLNYKSFKGYSAILTGLSCNHAELDVILKRVSYHIPPQFVSVQLGVGKRSR